MRKVSSSSESSIPSSAAFPHTTRISDIKAADYVNHPLFSRFWKTENVAQNWIRNYRNHLLQSTADAASRQYILPPPPPPPPLPPILVSRALVQRSRRTSKKRKLIDEETEESSNVTEVREEWRGVVSVSSSEIQGANDEKDDEEKVSISDDVLAFMAQTIRHRIEREKKKAYEQEIQDQTIVFVPADRPFMASRFNEFGGDASAVAEMLLRQGSSETKLTMAERKRQEMIRLYGDEAAGRIQAEETLMQMKFDQEYDKYHPPFWPNIPLRL